MPAKQKTAFFCSNCGNEFPKWMGQCPACKEWNTIIEEPVKVHTKSVLSYTEMVESTKPVLVNEILSTDTQRTLTPLKELNRVLGGGVVPGSLILLGGEPGIGKSTLALQVALQYPEKVLYVSGEESPSQIKMRADRISTTSAPNCQILSAISLEQIIKELHILQPKIVVIDSIQTIRTDMLESAAGSVGQIRECTTQLLQYAKQHNTAMLIIGHITKEGAIAGPKILEHIVDTVLQFEGDTHYMYRIIRAVKNRFGSTSELGIFEMVQKGLREVTNPSEILLSNTSDGLSGVAIACAQEGLRPLLIEVQALASHSVYPSPQRSGTGFDNKRLNMLLAVLEKRGKFKLANKDIFLNIAGGIKVNDPSIDMAVTVALASSLLNLPVDSKICFSGEIGLTGEVRPVTRIEQRVNEAAKLGFKKIVVAPYRETLKKNKFGIELTYVENIGELLNTVF